MMRGLGISLRRRLDTLFNALNQDCRVVLPVPLLLAIIFAPFVLEDKDLAVTPLFHDAPPDGYILQQRLPDLHLITFTDKDHLIQGDFATDLPWKFLELEHGSGFGLILFATGLKYRIHSNILQVRHSRAVPFLIVIAIVIDEKKAAAGAAS